MCVFDHGVRAIYRIYEDFKPRYMYSSLVTFGNSNTDIKISDQGFDFFNLVILITSTKNKFGFVFKQWI